MTSDRGVIRQTHSMIWAPRWLTALVVALASSVLMVVTTPARAADGETELGATQLAAQTYPGVQLIQADFTSTISVPQAIIDEAAVNELYTRLVVQAATGAIGTAESLTGGLVSAEHADAARGHGIPLGGVKVDMRRPTVPSKFEVWRGQEERRCG